MFHASIGNFCGRVASFLLLSFVLAGCASTAHNVTSASDFLNTKRDPIPAGTPALALPLSVGVAFVPGDSGFAPMRQPTFLARTLGRSRGSTLTEKQKVEVMQMLSDHFSKYPFVKTVTIIPSDYLKPNGGFENVDQLRSMYGVDVIALISYDQTQFSDQGALSLANLTIVGAYLVPGEKNQTDTVLDAAVFDIGSRKMLMRAPGTSHVKGVSTFVNQSEGLRSDSERGFRKAAEIMVENLDVQLAAFWETIERSPKESTFIRPERD